MKNKNLIILGAGESGASAARLGKREGYDVFVSDLGPGNPTYLEELEEAGIAYEVNGHTAERILTADEVVKSPGIPDSVPLIRQLREKGVPVISEIEFTYRFVPQEATIVAITGSNGKTTTTLLIQHLLEMGGVKSLAGGNLGDSFARLLLDHPPQDVYVLELSSFQLDGIVSFRPDIAAVLNITPDHLDRYGYSLEKYADSKLRITLNQKEKDRLYVLADPKTIAPALRRQNSPAELVQIDQRYAGRARSLNTGVATFNLSRGQLRGRHNTLNAWFALLITAELGVDPERAQLGLDSFIPAPHRMEIVPTTDGRTWINDSKATNVDSTYFALEAMEEPTVWIAGGVDKGNDYDVLVEMVDEKVALLICLGIDNSALFEAFEDLIDIRECHTLADAIQMADEHARVGDTILLSPACASFDLFKNYMDRGDQFRAAVKALAA